MGPRPRSFSGGLLGNMPMDPIVSGWIGTNPNKRPSLKQQTNAKRPWKSMGSNKRWNFVFWDSSYCWWLKSCTTWDVWNPINNGKNYLSTGAGFQPSTVCSGALTVDRVIKRTSRSCSKRSTRLVMASFPGSRLIAMIRWWLVGGNFRNLTANLIWEGLFFFGLGNWLSECL